MEGVLLKRGKQSWKVRRFVIENGTLSYTKSSRSKLGSLNLSTTTVRTFSSGFEGRAGYVFTLNSVNQSYTLEARTELERAQWLAACCLAGTQLDVRESGLASSYHTEGTLLKKCRSTIKMGYFGIKGSRLDYIMRGGEQKSVEVRGASISVDVESVDEYLFIIKPASGARLYVLKATSELERGRWVTALSKAAQETLLDNRQPSTSTEQSAPSCVLAESGGLPASEICTPKLNAQAEPNIDYSEVKLSPPREFNFHLDAKFSPPRNKRAGLGDEPRSSFNDDTKRPEGDEAKIDSGASNPSTDPIYLMEGMLFQKNKNSVWEEHHFGLSETTGLWCIDGGVALPAASIHLSMVHMLPSDAEARAGAVFTIESAHRTCTLKASSEADCDRWLTALKQAGAVIELPLVKIVEQKYFEGVLRKRSKKKELWKERYFVCGSNKLTYGKQKGRESKAIDTLGARILPLPSDGGRPGGFAFAIYADRTYVLEADSAAERQNWLYLLIPPPPVLPRTLLPGPPLARPPPPSRPLLVGQPPLPGRPPPPPSRPLPGRPFDFLKGVPPPIFASPNPSIAFPPPPPPPNPLSPKAHIFPALPRRLFTVQEEPATPRPPSRKPPGGGPPRTSLVI